MNTMLDLEYKEMLLDRADNLTQSLTHVNPNAGISNKLTLDHLYSEAGLETRERYTSEGILGAIKDGLAAMWEMLIGFLKEVRDFFHKLFRWITGRGFNTGKSSRGDGGGDSDIADAEKDLADHDNVAGGRKAMSRRERIENEKRREEAIRKKQRGTEKIIAEKEKTVMAQEDRLLALENIHDQLKSDNPGPAIDAIKTHVVKQLPNSNTEVRDTLVATLKPGMVPTDDAIVRTISQELHREQTKSAVKTKRAKFLEIPVEVTCYSSNVKQWNSTQTYKRVVDEDYILSIISEDVAWDKVADAVTRRFASITALCQSLVDTITKRIHDKVSAKDTSDAVTALKSSVELAEASLREELRSAGLSVSPVATEPYLVNHGSVTRKCIIQGVNVQQWGDLITDNAMVKAMKTSTPIIDASYNEILDLSISSKGVSYMADEVDHSHLNEKDEIGMNKLLKYVNVKMKRLATLKVTLGKIQVGNSRHLDAIVDAFSSYVKVHYISTSDLTSMDRAMVGLIKDAKYGNSSISERDAVKIGKRRKERVKRRNSNIRKRKRR